MQKLGIHVGLAYYHFSTLFGVILQESKTIALEPRKIKSGSEDLYKSLYSLQS